jgi:hypothetical protein
MSQKLLSVTVKGKHKKWSFNFYGDPKHIDEWEADGLEIYIVNYSIPEWVVDMGLTKVYCRLIDFVTFNFKGD